MSTIPTPPTFKDQAVLVVGNGTALKGWQSVRVSRSIERLPSDFGLGMTERFIDASVVAVSPGDPFQLLLGADIVMTGYVDSVNAMLAPDEHTLAVAGRSKCADLIDCAAEWPGSQIANSNLEQIAAQLAKPYEGLEVWSDLTGLPIVTNMQFMLGETPYSIIERVARFSAALVYDDPEGHLILTRVGKEFAAGGLHEGINVENVTSAFSMLDRFSEYIAVLQALDMYQDFSGGSQNVITTQQDPTVPRHRRRIIIAENTSAVGVQITAQRAVWEMNRRTARSASVTVTTDSWRDASGALWKPNTLCHVELPSVKVATADLLIGSVTYRLDQSGTHADLTLMPPDAFKPEPYFLQPQTADVKSVDTSKVQ
jgi:prophage tail gpP-like protein